MKIREIKEKFKNKEIDKIDFVDKMHEVHRVLFD
jgi:hypothetical protein